MKVILKEDVKNLGEKNSVVEVKDGYARNYLLPKGLAVEANKGSLSRVTHEKEARKVKKDKELESARDLANKINNTAITITTKAGENGKLFGSITSMDIALKLKENLNVDIEKKKINISEPIKSLGEYEIEIRLYTKVNALLKVVVVGE
jgi:large subunit ribosomal protein L9